MDHNTADVLIKDICYLVEKQTAMAIRGDLDGVEASMHDAEDLMQQIPELKAADSASLAEKKSELQDMYKKLSLIIAGNKNDTFAELIKVRKSKKVFRAYKNNAK